MPCLWIPPPPPLPSSLPPIGWIVSCWEQQSQETKIHFLLFVMLCPERKAWVGQLDCQLMGRWENLRPPLGVFPTMHQVTTSRKCWEICSAGEDRGIERKMPPPTHQLAGHLPPSACLPGDSTIRWSNNHNRSSQYHSQCRWEREGKGEEAQSPMHTNRNKLIS